nr:acid phosphatase pho11 [Quercus suber]
MISFGSCLELQEYSNRKSPHNLTDSLSQDSLVQVYEGEEAGADSLTPYSSCPKYSGSAGSDQASEYVETYTKPILARLHALAPKFNWTSDDVVGMFEWCGYDTVVRGSSPFCSLDLFRPDEWLQFEYGQDIMYHYNTGYGSEVSGFIGLPWVNSTFNLLRSPPSNDKQDLYVSFTHRELPPTVLVALGLFNNSAMTGTNDPNATMPLHQINYHRQWVSSYILPFLTNVAIEQMNCSSSYGYQNASNPTFYRVLVNNSPQSLPGCVDGPLESCSATGLEPFLQKRVELFGGYSQACAVDYQNSTDVLSIYAGSDNGTMGTTPFTAHKASVSLLRCSRATKANFLPPLACGNRAPHITGRAAPARCYPVHHKARIRTATSRQSHCSEMYFQSAAVPQTPG